MRNGIDVAVWFAQERESHGLNYRKILKECNAANVVWQKYKL